MAGRTFQSDQREDYAYFQRELADSGHVRRIVGKAVCSYGYVDGIGTRGGWTFSLRPFGEAPKGSWTSCKIGAEESTCYLPPDPKDCILLTNGAVSKGGNNCLGL